MKVIVRFKKRGMRRFLSALDAIKLLERCLRRASVPLVFTEGYHPKPKMSFLDAMPVGVINLAFYVQLHVREFGEDVFSRLREVAPYDFFPDRFWITEEEMNKIVGYYRFKIFVPFDPIGTLEEKVLEKRGRRFLFREVVEELSVKKMKDYHLVSYVQRRDLLVNPLLLFDGEGLVLPICEEALTYDFVPLSAYLEEAERHEKDTAR